MNVQSVRFSSDMYQILQQRQQYDQMAEEIRAVLSQQGLQSVTVRPVWLANELFIPVHTEAAKQEIRSKLLAANPPDLQQDAAGQLTYKKAKINIDANTLYRI